MCSFMAKGGSFAVVFFAALTAVSSLSLKPEKHDTDETTGAISQDLHKIYERTDKALVCAKTMTFTIRTTSAALCVPSSGGLVEYTGTVCQSNKILWVAATAKTIRSGLTASQCGWDWTTHVDPSTYGGFCGVAPLVNGGEQLPTTCEAPQRQPPTFEFVNAGVGDCLLLDGRAVKGKWMPRGLDEDAYKKMCAENAECQGFSVQHATDAGSGMPSEGQMWIAGPLKGGGPVWNDATCWIKVQPTVAPAIYAPYLGGGYDPVENDRAAFLDLGSGKCIQTVCTNHRCDPQFQFISNMELCKNEADVQRCAKLSPTTGGTFRGNEIKRRCAANPNCFGYSHLIMGGNGLFWFENDLQGGGHGMGGARCMVKVTNFKHALHGRVYKERSLVSHEGQTLVELDDVALDACKAECTKNQNCWSFSYSGSERKCSTKSKVVGPRDPSAESGSDYITFYSPKSSLAVGETLDMGDELWDPHGRYVLTLQQDGELVGGYPSSYGAGYWWTSGTAGKGSRPYQLRLQSDGNLVLYGNGHAVWSTNTHDANNHYLGGDKATDVHVKKFVLQEDRNLVLYGEGEVAAPWFQRIRKTGDMWTSKTCNSC